VIRTLSFFQAEDGIRAFHVTGVQTCALPILGALDRAGLIRRDVPTVHGPSLGAAIDENDIRRPTATAAAKQRALAAPGGVRTNVDRKSVVEGRRGGPGGGQARRQQYSAAHRD